MLCKLLTGLCLIMPAFAASPPRHPRGAFATYYNNVDDLLGGQDGIPIHPADYQGSGKLATAVDVDGNAIEQAEAHLSYWEARYYLYSATWACGKFVYGRISGFGNINATQQGSAPNPTEPRGSEPPPCGIKTYSSPDLTSWKLEDFYIPPELSITPTKPVVRYSDSTDTYVMLLGNQELQDFYYLVSKSPGGPFRGPEDENPGVLSGPNIGHDFDIAVAPDGTHWMLTDTFGAGVFLPIDGSNPNHIATVGITWDVVVQKLNPDLISVPSQSNDTFKLVFTARELADKGLSMEASSFFHYEGYYYMLFAQTCQNCAGMTYYFYSKGDPLGPYIDGGILREDGCGAQNKGANVLPSADGEVVVNAALAYRSSPNSWTLNGVVGHANNNQALSHTLYWPLEFNKDHTIKPFTCPAEVQIPLAANITKSPPKPTKHQFDCRIRNWQSIEVEFNPPRAASNISFPVYQRNDDVTAAFTPAIIDGSLTVTLEYDDGSSSTHVFKPLDISWAASKISITPEKSSVAKMMMATNATTGCFGYIVEPKGHSGQTLLSIDVYGSRRVTPQAQVFLHSF